jgi:hypothetical protein
MGILEGFHDKMSIRSKKIFIDESKAIEYIDEFKHLVLNGNAIFNMSNDDNLKIKVVEMELVE